MLPFFFYAQLNCIQSAEHLPNITAEKHRKSTNFHELKTQRKSAENPHKIKVFQHFLKLYEMVTRTRFELVKNSIISSAFGIFAEHLPNIIVGR